MLLQQFQVSNANESILRLIIIIIDWSCIVKIKNRLIGVAILSALALVGCTQTQRTLSGAGIGAGAGAGISAVSGGNAATGAIVGGAVGAAAGALSH